MITKKIILIFGSVLFVFLCQAQNSSKKNIEIKQLKIGDRVPRLQIAKWIKGKPVLHFKKGHVYVLEFGATWCGPCTASIPHLSELSKKYTDNVTIISIHIWENGQKGVSKDTGYISRVNSFVKKLGDRINYTVAVDVPNHGTANTWMKASGVIGIPKSFIIDQTGILVWIGEPDELDVTMTKVISGKFDLASEEINSQKEKLLFNRRKERAYIAKNEGHLDRAILGIDSLIQEYPNKSWLYYEKYLILKDANDSLAYALVLWMLNKSEFEEYLLYLGQNMVDQKNPDLDLVIEVADQGIKTSPIVKKPFLFDVKARAYFRKGNIKEAIAIEQQGVDILNNEYSKSNSEAFLQSRKSLQSRIDYFRKYLNIRE